MLVAEVRSQQIARVDKGKAGRGREERDHVTIRPRGLRALTQAGVERHDHIQVGQLDSLDNYRQLRTRFFLTTDVCLYTGGHLEVDRCASVVELELSQEGSEYYPELKQR